MKKVKIIMSIIAIGIFAILGLTACREKTINLNDYESKNPHTNSATLMAGANSDWSDMGFVNMIPATATAVKFTDDKFPTDRTEITYAPLDETTWVQLGATTDDDIRGWLEGTTFVISADEGIEIFANSNCVCLFTTEWNLTSIDFDNFNTSNVTDMSGMFAQCQSLTELDVSNFDTSNVTDMSEMFDYCSKLTELDVSNWNTGNATNMDGIFCDCESLKTIYAGNGWDTSAVTPSIWMFHNCPNLVGGNGTTYNSSHTDATYACIDTDTTPGYLTYKAS